MESADLDNFPIAYLLTFTTYGTWLHGRTEGSVDRQHNRFDTPFLPVDARQEQMRRSKLCQPEYRLDALRRDCVLEAIRAVAVHRTWTLWAAHVRTNHVHVVVSAPNVRPEKVLVDFKSWSSRRLREAIDEDTDRNRWTQHGSTQYLWSEDELHRAVYYVIHRQGEPLALFPRDGESDAVSPGPKLRDDRGVGP